MSALLVIGRFRRAVAALVVGLLAVALLGLAPTVAQAATGPEWLPFKGSYANAIGCTWNNGCANGYHPNPAIDFMVPSRTPVYATGDGVLTGYTGCAPDGGPVNCGPNNFGNAVKIAHPSGRDSWYGHLASVARGNGSVATGDLIGYTGSSGKAYGTHLHYEERPSGGGWGTQVDPGPMLALQGGRQVAYPSVLGYGGWQLPCGVQPGESCTARHTITNDGYSTPPSGPVSVAASNNAGQMGVQLHNFPLGTTYYFCHAGSSADYPAGGGVPSRGSFVVTSPEQSWSSGLCSGSGNFWIGLQASNGQSYYSNQVTLGTTPPTITATNQGGTMGVQLSAFPTGTLYYFCHTGAPSDYPAGGAVPSRGSMVVSSPDQAWTSGWCSGSGNFWVGVQAADGHDYYSNQVTLSPPIAVPGPATGVQATAGDGSAVVTWSTPETDGGSPVGGYVVTASPGGATCSTQGALTCRVDGLTNGTAYTFAVQASNAAGLGSASTASNEVTPRPLDSTPPQILSLSPTDQSHSNPLTAVVTVTFDEPVIGVDANSFQLGYQGTRVSSTVSYDPATRRATLTPVSSLTEDRAYAVSLAAASGQITDAAGNSLAHRDWAFYTGPAPSVSTRTPSDGATNVALGSSVSATFTEPVSGVDANSFGIQPCGATSSTAATVSYNSTTWTAQLVPAAKLAANTKYCAFIWAGMVKDAANNPLMPVYWSFTTAAADTTPPVVASMSPAAGATGVATGSATTPTLVKATFSEAVSGVGGSSFTLKQGSTTVAAAVVYDASTRTATLTPKGALVADKPYTATLSSAVKDVAGNPLTTKSWTFTTGPRPTVTGRTPASGATSVSRTANITATFSEAVSGIPTTAAPTSSFTIKQTNTGTTFPSVASYNSTTRIATLNPTGTLLAKTQYTISLSSGVKDAAGNTLNSLSWTFTTSS